MGLISRVSSRTYRRLAWTSKKWYTLASFIRFASAMTSRSAWTKRIFATSLKSTARSGTSSSLRSEAVTAAVDSLLFDTMTNGTWRTAWTTLRTTALTSMVWIARSSTLARETQIITEDDDLHRHTTDDARDLDLVTDIADLDLVTDIAPVLDLATDIAGRQPTKRCWLFRHQVGNSLTVTSSRQLYLKSGFVKN